MAKKKANTSGQRLNRELLERARQQAREIEAEEEDDSEEVAPVASVIGDQPVNVRRPAAGTQRRSVSTAKRLRERNEEVRRSALTAEDISQMMANPTKVVTEAELRAQYGFVLHDLRSMGLLAAASFLILIALAVLLPH